MLVVLLKNDDDDVVVVTVDDSRSSKHLDIHEQVAQISSFTSACSTRTPTYGNIQITQFTYRYAATATKMRMDIRIDPFITGRQ